VSCEGARQRRASCPLNISAKMVRFLLRVCEAKVRLEELPLELLCHVVELSAGAGYGLICSCKGLRDALEGYLVSYHGWKGPSATELRRHVRRMIRDAAKAKGSVGDNVTDALSVKKVRGVAHSSLELIKDGGKLKLSTDTGLNELRSTAMGVPLPLSKAARRRLYARGDRWIAAVMERAREKGLKSRVELSIEDEVSILLRRESCLRRVEALGIEPGPEEDELYIRENITRRVEALLCRLTTTEERTSYLAAKGVTCWCSCGHVDGTQWLCVAWREALRTAIAQEVLDALSEVAMDAMGPLRQGGW
jgi:hypothetical protein